MKLTPSLVRTTFASNGVADGLVRSPGGVALDASNNIVISDFPNSLGRVQKFGTNGVLISRLGSYLAGEGSLSKPQSLAFAGSSGALFVADVGTNSAGSLRRRNGDATWQTVIGRGVIPTAGGLAWDPQGYLYISDTVSNRVLRISVPELADIPPSINVVLPPSPSGTAVTWWGGVGWYYTLQGTTNLLNPWTNVNGAVEMRGVYRFMNCLDTNNYGNYRMLYH
jgi:hypothetical protein